MDGVLTVATDRTYPTARAGNVDRAVCFGVPTAMAARMSGLSTLAGATLGRMWIAARAAAVCVAVAAGAASSLRAQATAVRVSHDAGSSGVTVVQQPSARVRYGPPESVRRRDAQLDAVPPQYAPPSGMCRIWVHGVPPSQQPAPTQCANAVRVRTTNSQVVFSNSRPSTLATGPARPTITAPVPGAHPVTAAEASPLATHGGMSVSPSVPHPTSPSVGVAGNHVTIPERASPPPHLTAPSHPPAPHVSVRAHH